MKTKNFFRAAGAVLAFVLIAGAAGCAKKSANKLTIGATRDPHARLLEFVKDDYKKAGYDLEIVEFTDYVAPNSAVLDGSLDANFFQHIPYLEERAEWSNNMLAAFGVHVEPFALYSTKYKNLSELPDGATIAVPNDPTNGGRAFLLLEANGLIKLNPGAELTATELDVVSNPHGYKFVALEAAALPSALSDFDAACINGNYAMQAGLVPSRDGLIVEGSASPYVNIVVVKKGTENDPRVIALRDVMLTPKVRDFIEKTWPNGSVLAIF